MVSQSHQNLKIGVICHPSIGGSGALATELGIWLAEQGHEVHFISHEVPFRLREGYSSRLFCHTVTLEHYDLFKYPPYTIALAAKIAEVAKWHKLDLLHVHYAIPHSVAAFLAREMCECPVRIVATLHGTDVTTIGKDSSYKELTTMALKRCCAVTTVSHSLKQDAENNFGLENIHVIHNFVDHRKFHPNVKCNHFHPEGREGEKVIVHMSNFRYLKNVDETVRVFQGIQEKIPARLFLIGDGEAMGSVQRLTNSLGLHDKVEFLGQQESVACILPRTDLFLLNSTHESFGLSVLEAMACGVPAVTTRVGGLPEVVDEGVTGHLCNPGEIDCMVQKALHILDTDQHPSYSKAAIERSQQLFNVTHIGEKYLDLYRSLLGEDC
jgi:N-acetyl-alpha-D-glucosaminyl L-malate synthase BshA